MPGSLIYQGPSLIDSSPIVVVLTGPSRNRKTGPMLQTWIMPRDLSPVAAWRTGADAPVCGSCPRRHRSQGGDGSCYVNLGQAPLSVWKAFQADRYPAGIPRGRLSCGVRLGSWGDPAAVPLQVWSDLLRGAPYWTGYTHRWRQAPGLKPWCMASVDSEAEAREAQAQGWRTFRVRLQGKPHRGEARCPASAESGHKLTCSTCPIGCGGGKGLNVTILQH